MKTNFPVNQILNCDVLEGLRILPDESIDLCVTSPPYNCGIAYDSWDDNLPWDKYYEWCGEWLKEILRVLKKDGRFCLNHYLSLGQSENRQAPLMKLNEIACGMGFKHHSVAIWTDVTLVKRTAWGSWLSARAPYINSPYEGILILYKDKWKKEKEGKSTISPKEFMESTSGVWNIPTDRERLTMATFPKSLPARCINLLSYEGDVVLDPFNGSGSTTLAAKLLKRNYIGIDISAKYCEIARERLRQETLF